jgi:uncharacterized protein (TIGR00296 family)
MEVLTTEEGVLAISCARNAIASVVKDIPAPELELPLIFRAKRGVFVTLTKGDCLRGCIGFPYPVLPLGEAIRSAAVSAALEDPRFPPVSKKELHSLNLDVTILTAPVPIAGHADDRGGEVTVGVHGLVVRGLGRSGLLLPQVATECGWDALTFLDQTCVKAGLPPTAWKRPDVEVLTFEGQVFHGTMTGTV